MHKRDEIREHNLAILNMLETIGSSILATAKKNKLVDKSPVRLNNNVFEEIYLSTLNAKFRKDIKK